MALPALLPALSTTVSMTPIPFMPQYFNAEIQALPIDPFPMIQPWARMNDFQIAALSRPFQQPPPFQPPTEWHPMQQPPAQQQPNLNYPPPLVPFHEAAATMEEVPEEFSRSSDALSAEDMALVCFGRITEISGKWEHKDPKNPSGPFAVELLPQSRFRIPDSRETCGQILPEYGPMIYGLLDEESLKLYASCSVSQESSPKKQYRASLLAPCKLEITVYGPKDLFDEIGSWFQEYDVYLQDPVECHLDVLYLNPQRLSSDDPSTCLLVSEFISQTSQMAHLQDIPEQPDMLDILSSSVSLGEAEQPMAIQTPLKGHQTQALTFMLRREAGWSFDRSQPDMWELVDNSQSRFFVNRISQATQMEEPPNFSGGIIADPMGFGKTLTMIALAATDLDGYVKSAVLVNDENKKPVIPATLIIIPPPLMGSWEEQLDQHVRDGFLQCRRHHGKSKLNSTEELEGVHIVLTSYHTVAAEWKGGYGTKESQSVLFSVRWRRIILDEAHFIRNGNSRMAKATCSLDGVSRWAVTGTPIQNRLTDLAALLSFIRAHPYTDPKTFDTDISRLWKSGEDEKAAKRLKNLSAYLLLRRPKKTIELPRRVDTKCYVDLYPAERELYNQIREQALSGIDAALQRDSETSRAGMYVNALQKIESLRLVCDLGLHYHTRKTSHRGSGDAGSSTSAPGPSSELDNWAQSAQSVFNTLRDRGVIVCLQCSSTLELMETLFDDASSTQQSMAQLSRCLRSICTDCAKKLRPSNRSFACGHRPPCPTAPVSTNSAALEDIAGMDVQAHDSGSMEDVWKLPSKVEALLADLKSLPPNTKCVVFSTWRLTLDVIQKGLDQIAMKSTRFDGKVPQRERQAVIDHFRNDSSVRVMLLTLSCGAVGLTLTVATRAYLMEPHWNPTLEEQALARIHRLGQTKEVTTVRFFMRDSFEEQIIKLQESKKQLAGVLLSHHDNGHADDSLEGLHKLRALL